ncbi:MAG: glycosyltransferase [Candidatus Pacearchaeota archaeon]
MKVIQISTNSHAINPDKTKFNLEMIKDWPVDVAMQLKKEYPKLDVECWGSEKQYKKDYTKEIKGIKFRIFPALFSVRNSMEISLNMLKALKQEQKRLKGKEKLIIHFHEPHAWQVYLILSFIDKNKNIKIISQHHGGRSPISNLKKNKKLFLLSPLFFLMQILEKKLFKKIDVFYALSDEEINYLKKVSPKSRVEFSTMGIEGDYFKKADKNTSRKKLGLDLNKKYVLFIGRVSKNKGMGELITAAQQLKDIQFLLIGKECEKRYREIIEENKINNVSLLGTKYGKEKSLYLSASDCLILPSYTEGAPVVIMEAIAKNLPVISTNVGGVNKMIKDKREGIIIRPKSASDIVLAIKEIMQWKNKDITKYSNKYKWKNIIKKNFKDYVKNEI